MKKIFAAFALSILTCAGAAAQGSTPDGGSGSTASSEPVSGRFWKASLPGGEYMVALGRISSIGKHTYVVDGAARVYEVTIADSSSAIARFYFIEPVTEKSPLSAGQVVIDRALGTAKDATGRAGATDVWSQVVKNYPSTTHSKTMEFRLTAKSNVDSLFQSVQKAWEDGRGEQFTVRSK